ncbi:MAG: response regulator transcription factor [Clostridia bacterium]|nr:response regulator transcription factor [Clostridia bacterium]
MKLKALIVDDELPARKELGFLLSAIPEVEVVGEAATAPEALKLMATLDYSVIFLDVEMPGMNGIELARILQQHARQPYVIFITAYEEYAVQAFEVNAVDYLLKPFDEKRLGRAIDKVVRLAQQKEALAPAGSTAQAQPEPASERLGRIPAEKLGKTYLIDENEVCYAYTEGDMVYLKTRTDKYMLRFTLKDLESRLPARKFFRTHRCYLVNLERVQQIVPFFNGTYTLIMDDNKNSEVPVSRNQAKKLRRLLGI